MVFDIADTIHCTSSVFEEKIRLPGSKLEYHPVAQAFWGLMLQILFPATNRKINAYKKGVKNGTISANNRRYRTERNYVLFYKQIKAARCHGMLATLNSIGRHMLNRSSWKRRSIFDAVKKNLLAKLLHLKYSGFTAPQVGRKISLQALVSSGCTIVAPYDEFHLGIVESLRRIGKAKGNEQNLEQCYSFIVTDSIGAYIPKILRDRDINIAVLPGCGLQKLFNFVRTYIMSPFCSSITVYGGTCDVLRRISRNGQLRVVRNPNGFYNVSIFHLAFDLR
jgi:hypothetical protein